MVQMGMLEREALLFHDVAVKKEVTRTKTWAEQHAEKMRKDLNSNATPIGLPPLEGMMMFMPRAKDLKTPVPTPDMYPFTPKASMLSKLSPLSPQDLEELYTTTYHQEHRNVVHPRPASQSMLRTHPMMSRPASRAVLPDIQEKASEGVQKSKSQPLRLAASDGVRFKSVNGLTVPAQDGGSRPASSLGKVKLPRHSKLPPMGAWMYRDISEPSKLPPSRSPHPAAPPAPPQAPPLAPPPKSPEAPEAARAQVRGAAIEEARLDKCDVDKDGDIDKDLKSKANAVALKMSDWDFNNDGKIEFHEFKRACMAFGKVMSSEAYIKLFKTIDVDGSGAIDKAEFITSPLMNWEEVNSGFRGLSEAAKARHKNFAGEAAKKAIEAKMNVKRQEISAGFALELAKMKMRGDAGKVSGRDIAKAFQFFDVDGSGSLTYNECIQALEAIKVKVDRKVMNKILQELDDDGTGEISYAEFAEEFAKGQAGNLSALYKRT